jgi:RHS repeat-associated protein
MAGTLSPGYSGDGGYAVQARLNTPKGLTSDGEGNIYIADFYNNAVRKTDPDGIISTVAGNGTCGYSGDGGPAADARLCFPRDVAADETGNLYIADSGNHVIRKIDTEGIITTVAGNGTAGYSGDEGPAAEAQIGSPNGVAADSAGNIYIADIQYHCIRQVSPGGIIFTLAGNGTAGYGGHGGPAAEAILNAPADVITDSAGKLYIADAGNHRIRKVDISGIITTAAGNGTPGYSGEGGPAVQASLNRPAAIAADRDGNIYIADTDNNRIRKVDSKGLITTVGGDGTPGINGISGPPARAWIYIPSGITVHPSGILYVSEPYWPCILGMGSSAIGDIIGGGGAAWHDPAGLSYIIMNGNQHTWTLDSETQAALNYFHYDTEKRLTAVYDRGMSMTYIQRDSGGTPTAIISPDGITTYLTVNASGHLEKVTYPDSGEYLFEYTEGGLMTAESDPEGNRFEHVFDTRGRLLNVSDPEGGLWEYSVTQTSDGTVRTGLNTAEGRQTLYTDRTDSKGEFRSVITGPDGGTNTFTKSSDGLTESSSLSCGTDLLTEYAAEPGLGYLYPKTITKTMPSGLERKSVREKVYEDDNADRVAERIYETLTVNNKAFTRLTDRTVNTETLTSPENRTSVSGYDPDTGLPAYVSIPGFHDTTFGYDTRARLTSVTTGTRRSTFAYGADGNLSSVTDPENRTTSYDHDAVGRVTAVHRPDSSSVYFTYDKNGNMTVLTNPNPTDHSFDYNSVNLNTSYQSPLSGSYRYVYDRDRHLKKTVLPSGNEITNVYADGKLMQTQFPEGTADYDYYPCGTKLRSVTGDDGESIGYTYDGSLLTSETLSGTLNAGLSYAYNNDFAVKTLTYAGSAETYTYDDDGLLTGAGRFSVARNAGNGLPESVTDGTLTLSRSFSGYGETASQTVTAGAQNLSQITLTRDNAGRITGKTERVGGVTSDYIYTYDEAGRLLTVTKDGVLTEEYRYSANGSRVYEMNTLRGISGRSMTYSHEDHLLTAGNVTYTYSPDGFLTARTAGTEVTAYDYSSRGELLGVTLPGGTSIEYIHDPLGRRIAKKVSGIITEKYLWSGLTTLLAVYDGNNNLLMRFEYADSRMPFAVMRPDGLYYMAYDQVGSLKLIAGSAGNVVKRVEYDTFGNIISDSAPSFEIPFGFAGGLHDRLTGLVRFGYRDYDPETGRWTAKDPIGFAGGDTDIYGYCLNDPVNFIDPDGQHAGILIGAIGGAFTGFKAGVQSGSLGKGLLAGAIGGITGGLFGALLLPPTLSAPIAGAITGSVAGFVGRAAGKALSDPCSSTEDRLKEGLKGIPAGFAGGLVGGSIAGGASYLGVGSVAAEAAGAMAAAPIYWGGDMLF